MGWRMLGAQAPAATDRRMAVLFLQNKAVFWDPFVHKAALQDAKKQEPNSQTQHGAGGKHAAAFQGTVERIPPPSVKKTGCRPHSCSHRQGSPHQHKHIFSVPIKHWLSITFAADKGLINGRIVFFFFY